MAKKNIGSIFKPKKEGDSFYMMLAEGVTLSVHGVPVKSKYINLDDPQTLPDKLLELGKINEEVAESMRERAAKRPFIRFDLTVFEK